MKCQVTRIAALLLILGFGAGSALAQDSSSSQSLGDLARQLKAQRAKSQEKSKVYTNDDLSALPPLTGQSTAPPPNTSASPAKAKPGATPAKGGKETEIEFTEATSAQTGKESRGERYFRDRMGELEDRLQLDQRELNVLNQQLGQNKMLYYPDPYQALLQSSGPTAMSDVNKLQEQIAKKQADIAADQEEIENLREELRREGGDPGWLRMANPTGQASEPVAPAPPEMPEGKIGTKEYWQARFAAARARLADARERQQLAESELNLLQIQEVRTLDPKAKADFAEQVDAKKNEVSQAQAATQEAKKALEDLKKEFEASGAPDEWIQESDGE